MSFIIKAPATSANLGPGFDSLGIAVNCYLTVKVGKKTNQWHVNHQLGKTIPHDENNIIVKTALKIKKDLVPHEITVTSDIPLARGLGSSSSAIAAGIEIANQLSHLHLTNQAKIKFATEIEGHPDNVAPVILGDFTTSTLLNEKIISIKGHFPDLNLIAYIPKTELLTKDSRNVLPSMIPFKTAVKAGSIGNALVAALSTDDIDTAGMLMEADLYHENARKKLIPHLSKIRNIGHQHHAMATYLSGAGPTVITILHQDDVTPFINDLRNQGFNEKVLPLKVERKGISVEKI